MPYNCHFVKTYDAYLVSLISYTINNLHRYYICIVKYTYVSNKLWNLLKICTVDNIYIYIFLAKELRIGTGMKSSREGVLCDAGGKHMYASYN